MGLAPKQHVIVTVATLGPTQHDRRFTLPPVENRAPWIGFGLLLQVIGAAAPVAYVLLKAKRENVGGSLTLATIRLAWHQSVHSKAGLAVLIGGAVVFAAGAVLLARPFAKNWLIWLVAVPVAALVGVLVLGAAALVVTVILAAAVDAPTTSTTAGRTKKRPAPSG